MGSILNFFAEIPSNNITETSLQVQVSETSLEVCQLGEKEFIRQERIYVK